MKIIHADYIYTPQCFISNSAAAFTNTIQEIGELEVLEIKYPDATIIK